MSKVKYINPDKLERAKERAGANASEEQVLAEYLKLAGLAKDENGNVITSVKKEAGADKKVKKAKK